GGPDRVGIKDHAGGPRNVAAGDLLDEGRHVDMGRAGPRAGCVVTVEAAIRLDLRFGRGQRRGDVGEVALDLSRTEPRVELIRHAFLLPPALRGSVLRSFRSSKRSA